MREGKGWSSVTEFLRNQVESETVAHWHRAAQPPARLPNAGHLILGTRTFFKRPKTQGQAARCSSDAAESGAHSLH